MTIDYYLEVREIAHSLRRQGLNDEAQSLDDVIESGSTATEILMALRWKLQRIDVANLSMTPALRAEIKNLSALIDAALK